MLNLLAKKMPLAPHGKKLIANAMFYKGKQFLAASELLHQANGYKDVVLHLLCQGLEIVQKSLLLAHDYDRFKPMLADKHELGHDLVNGSNALQAAYALKSLNEETQSQLQSLNIYYSKHLLRYGTIHDVFRTSEKLQFEAVMYRAVELVELGNKIFQQ